MPAVIGGVRLTLLVVVAMHAGAVAISPQVDVLGALNRIEERLRGLEGSWIKLEMRLNKDQDRIDVLGERLDRMQATVNNRALHAQLAAERAANTCQKLNQKLLLNSVQPQSKSGDQRQKTKSENGDPEDCVNGDMKKFAVSQRELLAKEASAMATRMSNMYNDLWRRSFTLEGLVKESIALTNSSRRETHDGLRGVMQTVRRGGIAIPSQFLHAGKVIESVEKKLTEVDGKIEKKLEEVAQKQDSFAKSCHRIQQEEEQLDKKITTVLDKLFESIMNKTDSTNRELKTIQKKIQSYETRTTDGIARISNAAVVSAKESRASIAALSEEVKKSLESLALYGKKMDTLLGNLQELQERLLSDRNKKSTDICDEMEERIGKTIKNNMEMCSASVVDEERDSLVEKLTVLVESLQEAMEDWNERRVSDESWYRESDDVETVDHTSERSAPLMTTDELIARLNNIKMEKSKESVKDEADDDGEEWDREE